MKQNAEIRFSTTTEEKEKIKVKAKSLGMSIKAYLLYVGINSELELSIKK